MLSPTSRESEMPVEASGEAAQPPTAVAVATAAAGDGEVEYLALRKLRISNGPGKLPSTLMVQAGERFILDGDEPIDMAVLLQQGAVKLYQATAEDSAIIDVESAKRRLAAARPRLKRRST